MNRALMIGVCATALLAMAGCGSGGSGGADGPLPPGVAGGAVTMTIRWPARVAAALPRNTQSVRVTLYKDQGQTDAPPELLAGPKLVARPQSPQPGPARVAFDDLPPGMVRVEVTAHGTNDGSDAPAARGFGQGLIELGKRTQIPVEMFNNTARIDVAPPSLQLAPGGTQTLAATAFDFNDAPLPAISFNWSSVDPTIAQVDPVTGAVQALSQGQTEIIAREEGGTIEGRSTVTVR
jgi:uncharacterized protein YjdB